MKSFDVLVLGGGTAGTAAAKAAATVGARVAMFNAGELGGLCILRGCMPTKTMLHAAHLVHQADTATTPPGRSSTTNSSRRPDRSNSSTSTTKKFGSRCQEGKPGR